MAHTSESLVSAVEEFSPEEILDQAISEGKPEAASRAEATILGLKSLETNIAGTGEDNPAPEGVSIKSINQLVEYAEPVDNQAGIVRRYSPLNDDFLRGAAESRARGIDPVTGTTRPRSLPSAEDLANMTDLSGEAAEMKKALADATDIVRAQWAADLTGRFRMDSESGTFTAMGAADTYFGQGKPEVVQAYLQASGYRQLNPDDFADRRLEELMPDIHAQIRNGAFPNYQ